jgi:SAM-dependent methyltransferase
MRGLGQPPAGGTREEAAMSDPDWLRLNRANWNERVPIHLRARRLYDQTALRAGTARLDTIAEAALGPAAGLNILHLQCHFGMDSLVLAQQGASVTGIDFSAPAIKAARSLAADLGLADRAHFVLSDVYDARAALTAPESFDRVFVSWGALCWLPDMRSWARVVAHFLRPGGHLALAEAHPAAYVLDDAAKTADGRPGWFAPYLGRSPLELDEPADYADPEARLQNSRVVAFLHPLSDIIGALIEAGLRLERLEEHDGITWQMFQCLVPRDGLWRWPDRPWFPLSFSLLAAKP